MADTTPTATGGKIQNLDARLEEPLTQQWYALAHAIARRYRVHPNIVTTARLFLMIGLTTLFYYNRAPVLCALLLQVCWFLDHLDGEMARVHDLMTPFGDYYDHILDVTYEVPLVCILCVKLYAKPYGGALIGLLAVVGVLSSQLVFCQEAVLHQRRTRLASGSLIRASRLCVSTEHIRFLKYFGQSLLHLLLGALMIYAAAA